MTRVPAIFLGALILMTTSTAFAQADESEELKIAALEALMSAPPERALPIVRKVLAGSGSAELKERALFVLGQIDLPEAQSVLVDTAQNGSGALRLEAIRTIGIGGNPQALAGLADIYAAGDSETRDAVLEAWLIADDRDAVYRVAANTQDPEEFENAVETLGAMGALEQLRALKNRSGMAELLIEAYAMAGDVETLSALARDASDPERQAQAIQGLGVTGGDEVGGILVDIYRDSNDAGVREAALDGLMIAGEDERVLELYRDSRDAAEKRDLLQLLVMMGSDAAWDVIDKTLEDGQ